MTDREMLELVAKAACLKVLAWVEGYDDFYWAGPSNGLQIEGINGIWNPLDDDGDALRLAAKLRITIAYPDASHIGDGYVTASFQEFRYRYMFPKQTLFSEEFGDDPLPAIRRAIVRAAAQIQITKGLLAS